MIRGSAPSREPDSVDPEEIHEVFISGGDMPHWEPSPDSAAKQELMRELWQGVLREYPADYHVESSRCNDFNVVDPMVAVLVDVVARDGKASRVIEWFSLNAELAPFFWHSRTEYRLEGWENLVEAISSDGIALPLSDDSQPAEPEP